MGGHEILDARPHLVRADVSLAWGKSFGRDLLLGTAWRVAKAATFWGVTSLLLAGLTHFFVVYPQNIHWALKMLEALGLFSGYLILGVVCGVIRGLADSIERKARELEEMVNSLLDVVVQQLLEKLPPEKRIMTVAEFQSLMEQQFPRLTQAVETTGHFAFIRNRFVNRLLRMLMRLITAALRDHWFHRTLITGWTTVTVAELDQQLRRQLTDLIVGRYIGWILQTSYAVTIGIWVFLLLPLALALLV